MFSFKSKAELLLWTGLQLSNWWSPCNQLSGFFFFCNLYQDSLKWYILMTRGNWQFVSGPYPAGFLATSVYFWCYCSLDLKSVGFLYWSGLKHLHTGLWLLLSQIFTEVSVCPDLTRDKCSVNEALRCGLTVSAVFVTLGFPIHWQCRGNAFAVTAALTCSAGTQYH